MIILQCIVILMFLLIYCTKTWNCVNVFHTWKQQIRIDYTLFFLIFNKTAEDDSNPSKLKDLVYDISNLPFSLILVPLNLKDIYNYLDQTQTIITTNASTAVNQINTTIAEFNTEITSNTTQQFADKVAANIESNLQNYAAFISELANY